MRPGERRGERGFTLIELLVVVAIIGILATVAVGNYRRSIRKAQEAALAQNLYVMRTQINNYFADKQRYRSDLQALVDDRYHRDVPVDPITGSRDTWITEPADMGDELGGAARDARLRLARRRDVRSGPDSSQT